MCDAGYSKFEYWRDPEKTAAVWRVTADGRPAFSVGDLGRLDDDGYLYIDGRREDLIITGGMNVYPAQVEAALTSIEGIADAAVFGVEDDAWGQRVRRHRRRRAEISDRYRTGHPLGWLPAPQRVLPPD